jgi:hypothetical protein
MAPEQADLNSVPDARWDVYALGALLYCMLTGEPPHRSSEFLAEIEQQVSLGEKLNVYRRLIRESPAPAKHRDVPGVDRDLEEIIERCLQAQPSRRFPNPQAVLQALDARNNRRMRRPLLVLGAVGPAVLLGVLTWFAWSTYTTAISESDAALTRRAVETNGFAAQFVAETVASQIDRRWKTIERIADDADLRTQLARITAAGGFSADDQKPLQTWIERIAREHPDVQVASWVVMDGRGNQLARAPYSSESVGKNYAYRDYFNGKGGVKEGTPNVEPIRDVHLSNVFVSTATGDRKVAFSCPVWSNEPEADKRRVVGVLSITVALGQFAELRSPEAAAKNQVAALADSKVDSTGKAGSILEHPYLAEALEKSEATMPQYFDAPQTARLQELCRTVETTPPEKRGELESANDQDYVDPLGGEYEGRWLAAFRPVIVAGREPTLGNTGWVVIVQERHEAALRPVKELGDRLMRYGLTALGIVVAVVTALWGFVIVVLNESPRHGLARWLRKAGLAPAGTGSNSATAAGTNSVLTDRGPVATATLRQTVDQPSDR